MQIASTKLHKKTQANAVAEPKLPGAADIVLPDEPVPKLPRPVLVVPGGNARPWSLPHVLHYLCHGDENSYGGSIRPSELEKFRETYAEHGGNIFSIYYTRRFGSVEENAAELRDVIEAIREATGAEEIDIVAECKGALETRKHLQELGDGVRNLVQVVPPNRGMPLTGDVASLVAAVSEGLGLGIDKLGFFEINQENLDTFQDMRTQIGLGGIQWNSTVAEMNRPELLSRENEAIHSNTILMGRGHNTFFVPNRHFEGDGTIASWSAGQHGATHFGYSGPGTDHGRLVTHPAALQKISETLLTDGQPLKDENFISEPPSPGRAAAGLLLQATSVAGQVAALRSSLAGVAPGPIGGALMAASAFSATTDFVHAITTGETVKDRTLGAISAVGHLAGLGAALGGQTGLSAALLSGSQLLNLVSQ